MNMGAWVAGRLCLGPCTAEYGGIDGRQAPEAHVQPDCRVELGAWVAGRLSLGPFTT